MDSFDFRLAAQNAKATDAHDALYHAAVGRLVMEYAQRMDYNIIRMQVETEAVRLIVRIHEILNDASLNDANCCRKIDEIVTAFYRNLDLSGSRHSDWA